MTKENGISATSYARDSGKVTSYVRDLGEEWVCKLCGLKCKNNLGVGLHGRTHSISGKNACLRLKMFVQNNPDQWLPQFRDVEDVKELTPKEVQTEIEFVGKTTEEKTVVVTKILMQEAKIECIKCGAQMSMLIG